MTLPHAPRDDVAYPMTPRCIMSAAGKTETRWSKFELAVPTSSAVVGK